ncbi:hypothetical protein BpHYR1_040303 [Brachionus plicatilis]|uniref:Uncharacterized protein n=1 Tax=Brachionus plicatilis TaxID=10195 RepID=A0A3M7PJK1_BRAPC|nr:hypothetical protein BpHYR1_040303 [Brachionus plicatilis]
MFVFTQIKEKKLRQEKITRPLMKKESIEPLSKTKRVVKSHKSQLISAFKHSSLGNLKGLITESQKKALQLHLNGYLYRINNKNITKHHSWRWIKSKCTATCTTSGSSIGE